MTLHLLKLLSFSGATLLLAPMPSAHAHWGHVGELAGHGHWIALGAAAAAAALAAWLHTREDEQDEEAADEVDEELAEGEAA